jgi:threonine dehydrogenase-like Zn-dependent dehydrogenase
MRALVLLDDGVRLQRNHPQPVPPEGEALIRVLQAGICSTDLELVQGYAGFRGVLGHEFVGQVEVCGADRTWVGQRVVGEINAACRTCDTCRAGRPTHCPSRTALGVRGRDGAFADYLCLPIPNLHAVPESISDDQAVFVEPLAAALAITEQIHVRPTDRVALVGDGKLGLLIAQVLALTGCHLTVIGRHPEKLNLLAVRGIKTLAVASSSDAPDITADVVVEATGTPDGFVAARRLVRPRGTLALKSTYHGLAQADFSSIVVDEIHVIGTRCGPFAPALRLLELGLVDVMPLIHARYLLDQGEQALQRAGVRGTLKILIEI